MLSSKPAGGLRRPSEISFVLSVTWPLIPMVTMSPTLRLAFRAGYGLPSVNLENATIIIEVITTTLEALIIIIIIIRTHLTDMITPITLSGMVRGHHRLTMIPVGLLDGTSLPLRCRGWVPTLHHLPLVQKMTIRRTTVTRSKMQRSQCTVSPKGFLLVSKRKGSRLQRRLTLLKSKSTARRNKFDEERGCSAAT